MQYKKTSIESWGSICLSSAYLAPVEYYVAFAKADTVYLEQFDSYEKQTYRNRCNILTANGICTLTIPVEKSSEIKTLTRDIRISAHNDWQTQHWRTIESAYNSSPFFEYYIDDLLPFYEKKWVFLWDFNIDIQNKIFELLEIEKKMNFTENFSLITNANTLDLREHIHPKKTLNIELIPYYQVFDRKFGFIPNLSIIDLLFNMGNESQLIII